MKKARILRATGQSLLLFFKWHLMCLKYFWHTKVAATYVLQLNSLSPKHRLLFKFNFHALLLVKARTIVKHLLLHSVWEVPVHQDHVFLFPSTLMNWWYQKIYNWTFLWHLFFSLFFKWYINKPQIWMMHLVNWMSMITYK